MYPFLNLVFIACYTFKAKDTWVYDESNGIDPGLYKIDFRGCLHDGYKSKAPEPGSCKDDFSHDQIANKAKGKMCVCDGNGCNHGSPVVKAALGPVVTLLFVAFQVLRFTTSLI